MKQKTRLKEIEAWRSIKRRFARYARSGSGYGEIALFGLCYAVSYLSERNRITLATKEKMLSRIRRIRPKHTEGGTYYWPVNSLGAKERVKAIQRIIASL